MLPDGTVLVTGGRPTTAATDTANAIYGPSCRLPPQRPGPTSRPCTLPGSTIRKPCWCPTRGCGPGRWTVRRRHRSHGSIQRGILLASVSLQGPPTGDHLGTYHAVLWPGLLRTNPRCAPHRQRRPHALRQRDPRHQHGPAIRASQLHHRERNALRHRTGEHEPGHAGQLHALPGGYQRRALGGREVRCSPSRELGRKGRGSSPRRSARPN